ncbi:MAG: DUF6754 domain-containing protein [Candidatus Edwardsbacteria bacterium]
MLSGYKIFRRSHPDSNYKEVGFVLKGQEIFQDNTVKDRMNYFYFVRAEIDTSHFATLAPMKSELTGFTDSERVGPVFAFPQWFNTARINILLFVILFCAMVIWYINRAKRGESLFIRRIAGLDAVDEAVGRSTEMGRPLLYILGLLSIDDVTTLAGLTILGRVAKKAAEYETPLIVPCYDPLVMTTAQEIVKQSYSEAGRPDAYNQSNIYYLSGDQFGYAAGVDGIILREKPGAVFLQGYFYAESLILAETGHSIGAIQIAGTTATDQLPFFVTACDYTLIGEEMYAASSYLSREPLMLGSLKGEDLAKVIIVCIFIVGMILETIGVHWLTGWLKYL